MTAAAGHEGPECLDTDRLFRRHHRVLGVPVVGTQQVELEVLAGLAGDAFAEDDDPFGTAPGLDAMADREAVDGSVDSFPGAACRDALAGPDQRRGRVAQQTA
jgi:hypothetical protein